jgi:putative transcription factor
VINEYEQGKGIPDNAILSKIQRIIKIKLTGKNIGEPLNKPTGGGGAKKKK